MKPSGVFSQDALVGVTRLAKQFPGLHERQTFTGGESRFEAYDGIICDCPDEGQ